LHFGTDAKEKEYLNCKNNLNKFKKVYDTINWIFNNGFFFFFRKELCFCIYFKGKTFCK
jgi:hypothetical protein